MIMSTFHHTQEIIELPEDYNLESEVRGDIGKKCFGKSLKKHSFEDDINKFFEAIEIGSSRHFKDSSHERAMKRPMRVSPSHASGIGISEPVSLKQALRGLCISQASEMAAVKKRMSRPSASPGMSEVGGIKKMYRDVVIEAGEGQQPLKEVKGSFMEISFVSEGSSSNISHKALESGNVSVPAEEVPPITDEGCRETLELPYSSTLDKKHVDKLSSASLSSHNVKTELIRSPNRGCEQSLKNQNIAKKKIVAKRIFTTKNHSQNREGKTSKIVHRTPNPILEKACEELEKPSPSSSSNADFPAISNSLDSSASKHFHVQHISHKPKIDVMKGDERLREKGEFSQSSKSSIGEYSSTTSYSDESYLSTSNRSGYRPHMSKDLRWEAINSVQKHHGRLGMTHFKLVRKIGGGDIGTVYLAELIGTSCLFAVKVIDNEYLSSRKKMQRAQTEKEILEILDHPFLPTLFAHFTTNKYSCLVMEYCPGGDLHVLRQKQLTKSFPEKAARFYAAEILLALEYLHMLGVVYRDLKPENILVREDGHIMLSDFDLSLRCATNTTLLKSSSPVADTPKKMLSPCSDTTCIHPFCLQPSWQLSCFTPRFLTAVRTWRVKSEVAAQPQLVVEPTTARSNSFVGTHEYIAPEIIKGEGHGSAVDWWTFGVFFYELLYGTTPFRGSTNEETISNVVSKCLKFPQHPTVGAHARDLMRRLLKKEPEDRLGSAKGAAEIKKHPFFEGLNWALIRCETPPELPKFFDAVSRSKENKHPSEFEQRGDEMEFEMF